MGYKDSETNIIKVDYSPEIDAINAKLSDQDAQSTTLAHGLNAITTDQATPTEVKMMGRTLVNLLGKDGSCEDLTKWSSSSGGAISIDSTNYVYGTGSIKNTLSSSGALTKSKKFNIDNTKYYLFIAEISGNVSSSYVMVTKGTDSSELKRGNTITNNTIGDFQISYLKLSPSDLGTETSVFLNTVGNGATGNTFNTDGARLYEIPKSIYDKEGIDSAYTGDVLADKFPHMDSVQHTMNPFVKNSGKNLIPPFTSGKWTLNPNAKVLSDYELELDATGNYQSSDVFIPILGGTKYTFSSIYSTGAYYKIEERDKNDSVIVTNYLNTGNSITFTSNVNSVKIHMYAWNGTNLGTFTFTNPQLELGSTGTPFEPQNESYLYVALDADKNPILLASNNDGSVADEVYQRDGQWYRLDRFKRDVVLDGSLALAFYGDYVGFKSVQINNILSNSASGSLGNVNNYNGKILSKDNVTNESDSWGNAGGNLRLTISDTDSGWGETYTPTADEIKAYFYGWKMNNGTFGTAYAGTGTKTWVPIGDTDNTRSTTLLPIADAPTIAEGKIDHYKLTYQLSNAVEEAITVQGSLDLHEGGNQLQLGEGVQITVNNDGTETITFIADNQKYKQTSAINNLEVTYNTNLKTVVDTLVKQLEDAETQISILQDQMVDVIARLTAGGL